ncbi:hypothetical protein SUGI_0331430 [Cryptomeria japonica]|nr:hypothetical protein SUGI_0331430 [Cryptomeria japonica]
MEIKMGGFLHEGLAIYSSLVFLQVGYAVLGVVMKTQLSNGINALAFLIYANAFGFLVLSPFAFLLEKEKRPKLNLTLAGQFFMVSLAGVSAFQALLLMGLKNTTPAFASAMPNLGPAIIFVMAWGLGMEKVDIKSITSRLKIVGTIACVCGAMAMSFLQGPTLSQLWSHSGRATETTKAIVHITLNEGDSQTKVIGCIYLISAVVMLSSAMILQAEILKKYPAILSIAAITALVASFQIATLKIIMDRGINKASWSLDRSGFLTLLYVGVICNGLAFALQIWCMKKRGPVFVAIFSPVSTVCSAILSGETLRLGSMMGVILIFVGLYLVLWGKSKEKISEVLSSSDEEDQTNNTQVNHSSEEADVKTALLPRQ